ncbi:MAG: hypothetical protein KF762_04840 [Acidobacteria bacterium]|nr:hypothetical protein [Acidobacteriota bacterium]
MIINDYWEYVDMWLRRRKENEAIVYWNQAKHFYTASLNIPNAAAPLTLYYTYLNAVKALLTVKKIDFKDLHGATGDLSQGKTNLKNEIITFHPSGVLASLSGYFGDSINKSAHSLKDLLYNLCFIHRCFTLTYKTDYQDLFIPVSNPRFVLMDRSNKAWFCGELAQPYSSMRTVKKIECVGFERDLGVADTFTVRKKKRFDWFRSGGARKNNFDNLTIYHRNLRRDVHYIVGPKTLWYIKRSDCKHGINRHPLPIMLASMHRLSELARYRPTLLSRHFELDQNWLLSEFIRCSPQEFIDQIACEMTNQDFMFRGHRGKQ